MKPSFGITISFLRQVYHSVSVENYHTVVCTFKRSSAFSLKSTKKIVGAIGCNIFFALKNYEHETETLGMNSTRYALKVTDFFREPPEIYFIQKKLMANSFSVIHFPQYAFFQTHSSQKLAGASIISRQ